MEENVERKEPTPPVQEVHKMPSLGSRSKSSEPASKTSLDSKGRRKKKEVEIPGVHRVTFTVTIAMAVATVDEDEIQDTKEGKKKRLLDAPRAQNFFHFEYNLFPDDEEPVKTDVVTFGMAAKIYTERQEPKVLKTWVEGEHTWIAWTHCHTVTVTDKLLAKLFTHNLQLRVWDSKEKMSTRAKFDRPKAFRLPQTKPGDDADCAGGVKTLVMKQVRSYKKLMPKKSFNDNPLPGLDSSRNISTEDIKTAADQPQENKDGVPEQLNAMLGQKLPQHASGTISTLVTVEKGDSKKGGNLRSFSRLGKLAGIKEPVETKEQDSSSKGRKATPTAARSSKPVTNQRKIMEKSLGRGRESTISKIDPIPEDVLTDSRSTLEDESVLGVGKKKPGRGAPKGKAAKKADTPAKALVITQSEILRRDGIICLPIKMSKLFAGMLSLTERLEKPVESVDDLFLGIVLNTPLMSEEQKIALNPLVVTVHAATNMPDTSLSFSKLRRKCDPVHVRYKLYSDVEHVSATQVQDRNLYWDDINVLLAGKMHQAELKERLRGTPLEIEVHDRDRLAVKRSTKAKLFGDELEDEKISHVGAVASKRTMYNPFTDREKPWNPYGVAKFDLSDLLLGQQLLYITSPILPCPSPDILGMKEVTKQDGKIVGVTGAVDGPVTSPLPMGHYIQANSTLKIKVTLAYPLATPASVAAKVEPEATFECPFARIVFLFPYKNLRFLHLLHSFITDINSCALNLEDLPMHVIQGALSTYKLSMEQQQSRTLDILTGFQLLDSHIHMFVLEGLQKKAIKRVWDCLQPEDGSDVQMLYNSEFSFSERLYGPLDVDVCRIKLHEPLSIICKQPLLYVRDMVPKPCFQSLVKLEQLSHCPRLRDAVRNDLFPTADMVLSMSREFGVPMTTEDFDELNPEVQTQITKQQAAAATAAAEAALSARVWTPLDNYNEKFIHLVKRREEAQLMFDYEKTNKESVHRRSEDNSRRRSQKLPLILRIDVTGEVYNYGPHALNSAELAKEQLRQMLSKNPHRRYTYCQHYQHMTIVPENPDEIRRREAKSSRDRMKTMLGWQYPGKKTMAESNRHPMIPNLSRIMDLQQQWEENTMFANERPVLDWRRPYDWPYRQEDMDVWSKAPAVFGADEPLSIHLPGELGRQEQRSAQQDESNVWKSKLVVDDARQYFYRCATELQPCGFKAPNQLAKLKGLLKDPPQKLSLRKGTMALQDIPSLGVVQHPELDPVIRSADARIRYHDDEEPAVTGFHPGAEIERDWNLPGNQIPVPVYDHEAFKEAKGQDFILHHRDRDVLHKRQIQRITAKEYDLDLFQWPEALKYLQIYGGPDGTGPYVLPTAAEMEALGFSKHPLTDSGIGTFATTLEDTAPAEAMAPVEVIEAS